VKYIAKKFNRETNYKFKEEFYQAGLLGLAKALSKFDHEKISLWTGKPVKLSSFAYFFILDEVRKCFKFKTELLRGVNKDGKKIIHTKFISYDDLYKSSEAEIWE
jgi:DNA-directed RNA polymerase specialized sigma subunit